MKLSEQFIEEISQFETIYCLTSGGWHSTASGLLLKDYGFENVILLHNNTHLEMKSSKKTMKELQKITQYKYIEIEPDLKGKTVWDIMKEAFQKIPEIREDVENGKYDRTKIPCCNLLKKYPSRKFYKSIPDNQGNFVIISSICPFEKLNRASHLKELRGKNTFLRFHKKAGGFWFAYPFRDYFSEKEFLPYLRNKGFNNIKHSACVICPLAIVFRNYKSPQYYLSLKAMARAGMPCFQKTIMDFMEV